MGIVLQCGVVLACIKLHGSHTPVINSCILGSVLSGSQGFPLSCSRQEFDAGVVCRLMCFMEQLCVGRGGKLSAVTWTVAFHHTDQPALIYAASPLSPREPGPGSVPPPRGPSTAAAAGPPPLPPAILLYHSLCSGRPPSAQPIRRWRSQQAPANPWPAFAGNAKPLGEKQ